MSDWLTARIESHAGADAQAAVTGWYADRLDIIDTALVIAIFEGDRDAERRLVACAGLVERAREAEAGECPRWSAAG